jgi:hypothetical protein
MALHLMSRCVRSAGVLPTHCCSFPGCVVMMSLPVIATNIALRWFIQVAWAEARCTFEWSLFTPFHTNCPVIAHLLQLCRFVAGRDTTARLWEQFCAGCQPAVSLPPLRSHVCRHIHVVYPLSEIPKSENIQNPKLLRAAMNTMLHRCRLL